MTRILTMTLMFAAIISAATPVEARRCLTGNGANLNGVATSAPVVIVAIELPSN
jgi:hypothetical protein